MVLLGVNIDHVATIRNARGNIYYPDPVKAAQIAEAHGADGITIHLREDRRHIRDEDLSRIKQVLKTRLNLEMANTEEMVAIAIREKPHMVTLVPEKRQELTTEGGLNVVRFLPELSKTVSKLQDNGIEVSLFIDPEGSQLDASRQTGASIVEFHTGQYCEALEQGHDAGTELAALIKSAQWCVDNDIQVNAGHGLNYENVTPVLDMPGLVELNIGHSIIAESIFIGLGEAVSNMKQLITR